MPVYLTEQQFDNRDNSNHYSEVNDAFDLFNQAQIAFAHCEANGIKIDKPYLDKAIEETNERIGNLEKYIYEETKVGQRIKEIFGDKAKLTNRNQVAVILFKDLPDRYYNDINKEEAKKKCFNLKPVLTSAGSPIVSEAELEKINNPDIAEFAKQYSLYMSLYKMLKTNLEGILGGLDENTIIHPSFLLFSVISYRTSSSEPNFQNFPNHNKELSSIVRRCFVPRDKNRYLCEVDYSGAEVRVNASINQDPTLVGSIERGIDFHKAVAAKSYMLDETQVTKKLRQSVKGTYTFAAFYGSYWGAIAKGLWDNINYGGLTLEDGTPLIDHIHSKGIYKLGDIETPEKGTYGEYIYNVDQWFWGVMFKRYAQWKFDTWEDYQYTGYVDLPSGFRCGGIFTRNMVTNMPAQGSSAHCLLWSFCQLSDFINKRGAYSGREGYRLETKIGGQIHDSILLDIPEKELNYILYNANKIMTQDLREHFKWITVPMEIEADVSPIGKSWLEKEPYQIPEEEVPFPYTDEEIRGMKKEDIKRMKEIEMTYEEIEEEAKERGMTDKEIKEIVEEIEKEKDTNK